MTTNPDPNSTKLPANLVYEDGISLGNTVRSHIELNGDAWNGIDWDEPITTPEPVQRVTTAAATELQYANMSHLILCGKLMSHELPGVDADISKLAVCLSAHKVEDADLWGRYLQKTGAGTGVSQPLTDYYQHLFSEDNALTTVLGMELLGGPVAHTLYTELQHVGDPVFQQIAANLAAQKEAELHTVIEHLHPLTTAADAAQQEQLSRAVVTYTDLIQRLLQTHAPQFAAVGINPEPFQEQTTAAIQQFLTDLELDRES